MGTAFFWRMSLERYHLDYRWQSYLLLSLRIAIVTHPGNRQNRGDNNGTDEPIKAKRDQGKSCPGRQAESQRRGTRFGGVKSSVADRAFGYPFEDSLSALGGQFLVMLFLSYQILLNE
jgi:hypothetical protein